MVLSKTDIKEYCKKYGLIEPYNEKLVQTCSYDLTFGGEYYYYQKKDGNRIKVRSLKSADDKLYIPADAICYVLTEESVKMPNNLTASISLSFGLIKKGVMLAAQPPYDPGYEGKTVALLHNLSDEEVEISKGEHILNIIFNELSRPVEEDDLYSGKYQKLESLKQYCTNVKKGAVFVLKEDLDAQKRKFDSFMPMILTVITVIIAVLTILFTFLTVSDTITNKRNASQQEIQLSVENDSLYVYIDGKRYKLEPEAESLQQQNSEQIEKMSGEE